MHILCGTHHSHVMRFWYVYYLFVFRNLYHCKPVILQGDESKTEHKHYIELTVKAEWPEGHIITHPSDLAIKRPKVRCDSQEIAHKVRLSKAKRLMTTMSKMHENILLFKIYSIARYSSFFLNRWPSKSIMRGTSTMSWDKRCSRNKRRRWNEETERSRLFKPIIAYSLSTLYLYF